MDKQKNVTERKHSKENCKNGNNNTRKQKIKKSK
jgi:hypothetical protein